MEQYKPIDVEQTNELIAKSKAGNSDATEALISGNFPLILII